ncbi:MAG: diadenylate cyclase CdaA [Candidatus Binataceae bacterium]
MTFKPDFIPGPRWMDAIDIGVVAFIVYRIMLLIRGTRAVQMVLGLALLGGAYIASQRLGLFTVNWLLNNFLGSLIVILVVIFQADIRRALTHVGTGPFLGFRGNGKVAAEELAQAAGWLSAHRIGGLVVLEREVGLSDFIEAGRPVDARLSAALLETIFMPGSPLHDGAVIVQGDQVVAAKCVLPLSTSAELASLGTRHRAAIGLTEETDAVVVVVSEEDGTISLAQDGVLTRHLEPATLRQRLETLTA